MEQPSRVKAIEMKDICKITKSCSIKLREGYMKKYKHYYRLNKDPLFPDYIAFLASNSLILLVSSQFKRPRLEELTKVEFDRDMEDEKRRLRREAIKEQREHPWEGYKIV